MGEVVDGMVVEVVLGGVVVVEVVGSGLEVEVGGRRDEDSGAGVMIVSRWVTTDSF